MRIKQGHFGLLLLAQDDLDQINYTKGAARLTISIQAYKEEKGRMWYTVDYTYRPSAGPQPQ